MAEANGTSHVWVPIMAASIAAVIAGMAGIIVGKGNGDLDFKYLSLGEHKQFVQTRENVEAGLEKEISILVSRLSALEAISGVIKENETKLSALASQVSTLQGRLDTALMNKRAAR
jgi:hypothetical protein